MRDVSAVRNLLYCIMAAEKVHFGQPFPRSEQLNIFSGTYTRTGQEIIIKQYTYPQISEFAKCLTEQFCQAKLHHQHICNIIDVLLTESAAGIQLSLCLEKLDTNLESEVQGRADRGERYREEELWEFLQGTVEALALAQDLVKCT